MENKIKDILDHFARYTNYDPDQKTFNLLSDNYMFHSTGKKIETLLSEYDKSGVLAVMYAKNTFLESLKNKYIYLSKLIPALSVADAEFMEEINEIVSMYNDFESQEYLSAASQYIEDMNKLTEQVCKIKMIGERNIAGEESEFISSVISVIDDLTKIRMDVYHVSGHPVGKIEKFTTKIMIFERMADCILYLEKKPDAIYFCYIRQYNTAEGYFAYVLKSNGNLFSLNDRVAEEFIGQHSNSRNNRWAEDHADSIFPYNFIFHYDNYDYKGCATKYIIDDTKLDFSSMKSAAYRPILIAMILLRNKWNGAIIEQKPVYLTSMFHDAYIEEHPGTDLMVLNNSEIAVRHENYVCGINPDKILTGEYNKCFRFENNGNIWVKLYGDGFKPDYSNVLSLRKVVMPVKQDFWMSRYAYEELIKKEENKEAEYYGEFIGTQDIIDREVYRKLRQQLAKYIKDQMQHEFESWGMQKVYNYVNEKLKNKKEKFIEMIFRKKFLDEYPEYSSNLHHGKEGQLSKRTISRLGCIEIKECKKIACGYSAVINRSGQGNIETQLYDDETGNGCTIYAILNFNDYIEIESMIEEKLPRIYQGWYKSSDHYYNGNSILNAVDAVGEIKSVLYEHRFDPELIVGFSKNTFKHKYYDWMIKNGYSSLLDQLKEAKRQERKNKIEAEKEKKLLLQIPFEKSDVYKKMNDSIWKYENKEEIIKIVKKLYETIPDFKNPSYSSYVGSSRATGLRIDIKVKGNKEKIHELLSCGWTEGRKRRRDGLYVTLSKEIPQI